MKSKAALSFSSGTRQATRAPWANFVESRVWRTRRMMPASSMALIRSSTVSSGTPLCSAITWKGWRWKPEIRSSEIARIFALIGSLCSTGTVCMGGRLGSRIRSGHAEIPGNYADLAGLGCLKPRLLALRPLRGPGRDESAFGGGGACSHPLCAAPPRDGPCDATVGSEDYRSAQAGNKVDRDG
jgi:hypothetical protein